MSDQERVWEHWYGRNPTNWKGSPIPLPALPEGSRILDVGCGTGSTLIQALELGLEVVGIDISASAISRARERISARGHDVDLRVADILDPELKMGKFDCVLLHHVLDNMLRDEWVTAVTRAIGHLGSGGLISFQDLSVSDVRFGKGQPVEKNTFRKGNGMLVHFFTIEEVRDIFDVTAELELEEYCWEQGRGPEKSGRCRIFGLFRTYSGITLGSTSGA